MKWFEGKDAKKKRLLQGKIDKITDLLRIQEDARALLKKQIVQLQKAILAKKPELEASKGALRKIVEDEIKLLGKKLDKITNRNKVINNKVHQLNTAQLKLEELLQGAGGVSIDVIDSIAAEIEGLYNDIAEVGAATEELGGIKLDDPLEKEAVAGNEYSAAEEILSSVSGEKRTAAEPSTDSEVSAIFASLENN